MIKIPFSRFCTLMDECIAVTIDGDLSFPVTDTDNGVVEITNTDDEGAVYERFFERTDEYSIDADGSIVVFSKDYDSEFRIRLLNTVKATA